MKHPTPIRAVLAVTALLLAAAWSHGQAPFTEDPTIQRLTADIEAQHRLLADNQTQIEEKLAQLAETLRLARIYAARSGNGGGE